jgi:hypothetical protein
VSRPQGVGSIAWSDRPVINDGACDDAEITVVDPRRELWRIVEVPTHKERLDTRTKHVEIAPRITHSGLQRTGAAHKRSSKSLTPSTPRRGTCVHTHNPSCRRSEPPPRGRWGTSSRVLAACIVGSVEVTMVVAQPCHPTALGNARRGPRRRQRDVEVRKSSGEPSQEAMASQSSWEPWSPQPATR